MTRATLRTITTTAAALLLVAGCASSTTPPSSPAVPVTWVVESVHYSGPRGENGPGGKGEHYVTCVPQADLQLDYSDRERWKEIRIPAEKAYTAEYDTGTPCPDGPVRLVSDPADQQ